jgi:DNA-binding MarR family transcriptional regulator
MDIAVFNNLYGVYRKHFGSVFPGAEPSRILSVLRSLRQGSTTQQQLIQIFKVKQPAVNKFVTKLCATGLVERRSSTNGVMEIELSDAGREAIADFEGDLGRVLTPIAAEANSIRSGAPTKSQLGFKPKSPRLNRGNHEAPGQMPLIAPDSGKAIP